MHAKSLQSHGTLQTLCKPMDCCPWGSCPWDSPGKNTGVGCHAPLQGIFPTQRSSLSLQCLLHWQAGSLLLKPREKLQESIQVAINGSDGKKNIHLQCGRPRFYPWVGKIPWRREWQPTPVFLPGEFYGQRSLAGYSPQARKESDTTEWLTQHNNNNTLKKKKDPIWGAPNDIVHDDFNSFPTETQKTVS